MDRMKGTESMLGNGDVRLSKRSKTRWQGGGETGQRRCKFRDWSWRGQKTDITKVEIEKKRGESKVINGGTMDWGERD